MTYLTPAEVAQRLKVSIDTVQRHRDAWGAVRVGGQYRFREDVLLERIEATAKQPPRRRQRVIRVPVGKI